MQFPRRFSTSGVPLWSRHCTPASSPTCPTAAGSATCPHRSHGTRASSTTTSEHSRVVYSRRTVGGGILKRGLEQGLEIGLEVSDGGTWSEPYNCRYLLIGRSRNAEDVSDTVTLTCQSMGWLANKILNNDTAHLIADGDNKGKRAFLSKNPGTIIRTILDENKARKGAGLVLAPGFDTGKDAAGANWKSVYTLYYSLGTSLNSMLSSMVGGGAIDWRTEGPHPQNLERRQHQSQP